MSLAWQILKELPRVLGTEPADPAAVRTRIRYMERNVGLPVRAIIILLLFYYLFFSKWFEDPTLAGDTLADIPPREMILDLVRRFFLIYVVVNTGAASLLIGMRQLPTLWLQRLVFLLGIFDAFGVAALDIATGGFDSILYWVFFGVIIRNAISTPEASRQIVLNLVTSVSYLLAGFADALITKWELEMVDDRILPALQSSVPDLGAEPYVLRFLLLILMTFCCYGVQVLLDKQRRVEEEAREFALRQQQLQATGRLAAEIAHQLKNPLGIINNAAFTLQRTVKEGKTITQQIQMIREEVERSDRIITDLMGYARLSEGRVEKLSVSEVLDHALEQVFPRAAKYEIEVERNYAPALPLLLMQRSHISEVFTNILINAREAMNGKGKITVSTAYGKSYSVVIAIADTGPGIPQDKLPKIFEPYFTTKEKGTGLGLAIVKHNTEIYGGAGEVESELGKGTRFTIKLPARTLIKIRR